MSYSCLVHLRNKFHKRCIITGIYVSYGCANDTVNHSKTHAVKDSVTHHTQ